MIRELIDSELEVVAGGLLDLNVASQYINANVEQSARHGVEFRIDQFTDFIHDLPP